MIQEINKEPKQEGEEEDKETQREKDRQKTTCQFPFRNWNTRRPTYEKLDMLATISGSKEANMKKKTSQKRCNFIGGYFRI